MTTVPAGLYGAASVNVGNNVVHPGQQVMDRDVYRSRDVGGFSGGGP
ncbi:hypothetical protein [Arthrobacter sp. H14]|nr:hypothetical protein [Arthrobacter sp. H14]